MIKYNSIEEQKNIAMNTNEFMEHILFLIESKDERFAHICGSGGVAADLLIRDKEKNILYKLSIEPISYESGCSSEDVIDSDNL